MYFPTSCRLGMSSLFCAASLMAGTAQATLVTQSVSLAGTNIFTNKALNSGPTAATLTATFNKFDASLGTLTGVSFNYDYEFLGSIVLTGQGIGGITLSGPLAINGVVAKTNGTPNNTNVTNYSSGTYAVKKTQLLVDNAIADFVGGGTFDFSYLLSGVVGGGVQSPGTISATLDLKNTSAVAVNYTYTPLAVGSVPEPSSLALVGASGMALFLQRRRQVLPARPALH